MLLPAALLPVFADELFTVLLCANLCSYYISDGYRRPVIPSAYSYATLS